MSGHQFTDSGIPRADVKTGGRARDAQRAYHDAQARSPYRQQGGAAAHRARYTQEIQGSSRGALSGEISQKANYDHADHAANSSSKSADKAYALNVEMANSQHV